MRMTTKKKAKGKKELKPVVKQDGFMVYDSEQDAVKLFDTEEAAVVYAAKIVKEINESVALGEEKGFDCFAVTVLKVVRRSIVKTVTQPTDLLVLESY